MSEEPRSYHVESQPDSQSSSEIFLQDIPIPAKAQTILKEDDEWNRTFEARELVREQEREQSREERDREFKKRTAERDQLLDDWKRKLKQDKAERDRECREARYAFNKQFRENSQLIWANLRTCANLFEFERVFREWKEQQQHEAMDSL